MAAQGHTVIHVLTALPAFRGKAAGLEMKEATMTRFYVYAEHSLDYVGELDATDIDTARSLATVIWRQAVKITTLRLTFNRRLAA